MAAEPKLQGRLSLAFSGKMLQMNITLLVLVSGAAVIFIFANKSTDPFIKYGGSIVSCIILLLVACFAVRYYMKQPSRPVDGSASMVVIQGRGGPKVSITNPPDKFFENDHIMLLTRELLVGYDENLCADGEVVGKASDRNYRFYAEAEKKDFLEGQRATIKAKKAKAARILSGEEKPQESKSTFPDDVSLPARPETN